MELLNATIMAAAKLPSGAFVRDRAGSADQRAAEGTVALLLT